MLSKVIYIKQNFKNIDVGDEIIMNTEYQFLGANFYQEFAQKLVN